MLQPKDTDWLNVYKYKTDVYRYRYRYRQIQIDIDIDMLLKRNSVQTQKPVQNENKRMEKDIPCKQKLKQSQSDNSYFRQNRS